MVAFIGPTARVILTPRTVAAAARPKPCGVITCSVMRRASSRGAACAHSLQGTQTLNDASHGDVVYCDPVYTTRVREQFDRYNSHLFAWDEQTRAVGYSQKGHHFGRPVGTTPQTDTVSFNPNALHPVLESYWVNETV